jgi:hypothetical protein
VVDVVGQPNRDPAAGRSLDRPLHQRGGVRGEVEVVDGDVERGARPVDEAREAARDVERRLAAVIERVELDQPSTA